MVLHLLPNYWPSRNGSVLHTLLNVPRCSTSQKKLYHQGISLIATSSYSIRGGKGWPGSKRRLSFPLLFCVHAPQDASSRPPLSPLLWLWLPPDVTPLLVTAQTLVTDFVVSVYLSQLFSLAVKFMEFHTFLNHYGVSFSWERKYTRSCMCKSWREGNIPSNLREVCVCVPCTSLIPGCTRELSSNVRSRTELNSVGLRGT